MGESQNSKKEILFLFNYLHFGAADHAAVVDYYAGEGDSMNVNPLGNVSVATPGTPVPLSTDPTATASKLFFQVIPGLTGKTYVGAPTMNKTTLSGVVRVLWPNATGGFSENFWVEAQDGRDSIRLSEYAVDVDVAGEGLLVTYWTE